MNDATPQPATATPVVPLITDDGETIRIVIKGATWVLTDKTADIMRRHRALYPDNSLTASAFWHGVLLALSTFTKEKPANGKERQATRQDEAAVEG